MEKINIAEKLGNINAYWKPKIVGELNNQHVKLAKLKGEFIWHHHDIEDEFFMVIKGRLVIKLKNRDMVLNEGEFFIIPHGVEHKPVADDEVHVLFFEPDTTVNTGNIRNERTVTTPETI